VHNSRYFDVISNDESLDYVNFNSLFLWQLQSCWLVRTGSLLVCLQIGYIRGYLTLNVDILPPTNKSGTTDKISDLGSSPSCR
jgi:hypothetical protein